MDKMRKFRKRLVADGRITRLYERGGIILPEPGETLEELSQGALLDNTPEAEKLMTCLLCDRPAVRWAIFMTGEEAVAYLKKRWGEAMGSFFGLCNKHDPHENEDEVCDAAYEFFEEGIRTEAELEVAEEIVNVWLETLTAEGYSKSNSLRIVLLKLREGVLFEGREFSDEMREALEIALKGEIRRESH